jgi:hypothetical protein
MKIREFMADMGLCTSIVADGLVRFGFGLV